MSRRPYAELHARAQQAKKLRAEGMSVEDIAERFGVSEWTVRPWLRWSGVGPIYRNTKGRKQ